MLYGYKKSENNIQRWVGRMQMHLHCHLGHGKFQWLLSWGIPYQTSIYIVLLFALHSWKLTMLLILQKLRLCFWSYMVHIHYCKYTCMNELLKQKGMWIAHLPPANSPCLSLFSCCRISKNICKGEMIHVRSSNKRSALFRPTPEKEGKCLTRGQLVVVPALRSCSSPSHHAGINTFAHIFFKMIVSKYMLGGLACWLLHWRDSR